MCDYSLESVASRPAVIADRLVTASFAKTITRGFAAANDVNTAVCVRPGTEIAFDHRPSYEGVLWFWHKRAASRVARFRKIDEGVKTTHHDALEFADGTIVILSHLASGQYATVKQLPAPPLSKKMSSEQVVHKAGEIITQVGSPMPAG